MKKYGLMMFGFGLILAAVPTIPALLTRQLIPIRLLLPKNPPPSHNRRTALRAQKPSACWMFLPEMS